MTLEKAIKLLRLEKVKRGSVNTIELLKAQRLSIEALKREETFRSRVPRSDWRLLPGETEEDE